MAKLKLAKNLAWCDLETTGLHPETGAILEVGVIITDRDLNELTRESSVVQFDLGSTDLQIDDYLRDKMHKDNGLWDECAASEVAIEELDQVFPELLRDYNAVGGPLCGNTPSFDRAWLQLHMPQMFRCFSHQH